jgi:hypothetical protein
LVNPKINQVQQEGTDGQNSDGPHGCGEVLSADNTARGSPLPVPLRVIAHDVLYRNFLYRNCFVFLPYFVTSVCCVPMKQQLSLLMVCLIVCLTSV